MEGLDCGESSDVFLGRVWSRGETWVDVGAGNTQG